jgi:glycerol-3-phosphate acyltransferase PlsY
MPDLFTAQLLPEPYGNYAIAILFGYLMGSVPFTRIINQISHADDVPETPDGRVRALDMYLSGHKTLAATALTGDILKGFFAAALPAATWGIVPAILAAFGAFVGHLYPAFGKFKGGTGIAPYFGALLLFHTESAAIMAMIWILTLLTTRYATLASVVSVVAAPLILIAFEQWHLVQLFSGLAALVVVRNLSNLYRLMNGHEPKVTF